MSTGKIVSVKVARHLFSSIIDRVEIENERIILIRYGKPVAAIVPIEDYELLQQTKK